MRAGIVRVSLQVLKEQFKLPDDVKFLRVRQTWEQEQEGIFEILVEANNLNEVNEGQLFPWVDFIITTDGHIKESRIENHQ